MPVAAAGDDHRKIVTGVIRGIAKIATHHHGSVIKQRSCPFLDLIHFNKELVKVLEGINLTGSVRAEQLAVPVIFELCERFRVLQQERDES